MPFCDELRVYAHDRGVGLRNPLSQMTPSNGWMWITKSIYCGGRPISANRATSLRSITRWMSSAPPLSVASLTPNLTNPPPPPELSAQWRVTLSSCLAPSTHPLPPCCPRSASHSERRRRLAARRDRSHIAYHTQSSSPGHLRHSSDLNTSHRCSLVHRSIQPLPLPAITNPYHHSPLSSGILVTHRTVDTPHGSSFIYACIHPLAELLP